MKKKFLLLVALFGVATVAASFNFGGNRAAATVPGNNSLVSVNNTGNGQGGNNDSGLTELSGDGKLVAFHSDATNLVSNDTNNKTDAFLRDIAATTTTRISVSTAGVQSNGSSNVWAISRTGRYVLFTANATNLVTAPTVASTYMQLYVRDTIANTTVLISQSSASVVGNGDTYGNGISSDGRYVLFSSTATNLGPTITNSPNANLYIADTVLGTFTLANQPQSGSLQSVSTNQAAMSCDGSLIVFSSTATNLVASDTNAHEDVFLLDRRAGSRVTNITDAANRYAVLPKISCNGDYIGFTSGASNLTGGISTAGDNHVFRYDRVNNSFTLLDQSSAGTLANGQTSNASGSNLEMSDSGNAVFNSNATNLSATSNGGYVQLYLRNVVAGTTEMLSVNGSGVAANVDGVSNASLSSNGSQLAFFSVASNLIGSDTNNQSDVFTASTGL